MTDEKHANDEYIDPAAPTAAAPVPPDVNPAELEEQLARERGLDREDVVGGGAEAEGGSSDAAPADPPEQTPEPAVDYTDSSTFSKEDLEEELERRNADREEPIEPTATGADGTVVRADLEQALADDDAAQAQAGAEEQPSS